MVSETKFDDTFPVGDFITQSTSYRLYRNSNGVGIILYIRGDIPSNLCTEGRNYVEVFYVEFNLRSKKWFTNCSYNPSKTMINSHLDALSKYLDLHPSRYENILTVGDFYVVIEEYMKSMKSFSKNCDFTRLIIQPTCYKHPYSRACINLILSNLPRSFQSLWDRTIRFSFNSIKNKLMQIWKATNIFVFVWK